MMKEDFDIPIPHAHAETSEQKLANAEFRQLKRAYLDSNHRKKVELIESAYRMALKAHQGLLTPDGQPAILHSLAVARIVISDMGLGSTSISAALLHDVMDVSDYTVEDISHVTTPKIGAIVKGLSKIAGGIFGDRAAAESENFRKLLLSMSSDFRVILIKIADRLANMRTLHLLPPHKQRRIAEETMHLYAPLAHRLGLNKIKNELEDLWLRYAQPAVYHNIQMHLQESDTHRQEIVEQFVAPVRDILSARGFQYEIKARVKSAYSIYKKMVNKQIPFEEIFDIYAVRIIFENLDDDIENERCHEIYSIFTSLYRTHPDRLRDWTYTPKGNGYRALHLTAMGPEDRWIEVQIRSRKMDDIAELGYAAHWKYKNSEQHDSEDLEMRMNIIKEILADPNPDSIDSLDTIKLHVLSTQIYVFSHTGSLYILPTGSSVLDLAYAIDNEEGNHCVAGKIERRLVPLSHPLESGDRVEVISSRAQYPRESWLQHCASERAQEAVKRYLQKENTASDTPCVADAETQAL